MSLAKFKVEKELDRFLAEIQADWKPIEFVVQELYFLSRVGTDPFEVKHVIPFGGLSTTPYFGENSTGSLDIGSREGRTIVISGLPDNTLTQYGVNDLFTRQGFSPVATEIILNPNRKTRGIGLAEFASKDEANRVLRDWTDPLTYPGHKPYLRPLYLMVFPDVIGGSCTLSVS